MQDEADAYRWVVFDGPVDALWIENMNTVLDDNMMLCLANGERIKLKNNMRMLFEVQDLAVASPATVSRCGMVWVPVDTIGWEAYIKTFFNFNLDSERFDEEIIEYLTELFVNHCTRGFKWYKKSAKEPIATNEMQIIYSIGNIFHSMLNADLGFKDKNHEGMTLDLLKNNL